jgi:hypothetical protein
LVHFKFPINAVNAGREKFNIIVLVIIIGPPLFYYLDCGLPGCNIIVVLLMGTIISEVHVVSIFMDEDGCNMLLQNGSICLHEYMASQPRTQ